MITTTRHTARHLLQRSRLQSDYLSSTKSFRLFSSKPSSFDEAPNIKNIEDDGYRLNKKNNFWTKVANGFKDPTPGTLILVRHGESEWNEKDLFTGWCDVDLSERGIREIEHAARLLLERGYTVDITYTSMLKRAIRSSWIILNEINQIYRPIIKSWRLNERMYGALEGHSKPGLAKLFSPEIIQLWRGGLEDRPPPMLPNHVYWHGRERKYAHLPSDMIPTTESLQDTLDRTIPLWESHILPDLKAGRNVMIVAHRNSIRGIIRHIDGITASDIKKLVIPNGIPLVYKFDKDIKPIVHKNAVPPISGIWLEKKGLLRAAIEQEAELASRIANYKKILSAKDSHLKTYYSGNKEEDDGNHPSAIHETTTRNTKSTPAPTTPRGCKDTSLNGLDLTNFVISEQASSLEKPIQPMTKSGVSFSGKASGDYYTPNGSNLVHNLTKLENERILFKIVQESSPDAILYPNEIFEKKEKKKQLEMTELMPNPNSYDFYDDNHLMADIYIDPNVLTSMSLTQDSQKHSHKHSNQYICRQHDTLMNQWLSNYNLVKQKYENKTGIELDLEKLNQIHYFEDSSFDVQRLTEILHMASMEALHEATSSGHYGAHHSSHPIHPESHAHNDVVSWIDHNIDIERTPIEAELFSTKHHHLDQFLQMQHTNPDALLVAKANDDTLTNATPSHEEDDDIDPVLKHPLLVIIRHGKTEHNKLGLFTGWEDAMLANEGREEAILAGKVLRKHQIQFDVVYTSWLSRAIETAWLVLNELDLLWLPIVKTWRLNERMYGALTGLSKKMIRQIYGDEQFMAWRRGYDYPPPTISSFSHAYPGNDVRYVNYVQDVEISWFESIIRSLAHGKLEIHRNFPKRESLKNCMDRTIPYFKNTIVPDSIHLKKNVLIASSENAIRGLLMHLCQIPKDKIPHVEIPTGLPLVYDPKQKKIRLLDDGTYGNYSVNPFQKYNFGSAPELLFDFQHRKHEHHHNGHHRDHRNQSNEDEEGKDIYWKNCIVKLPKKFIKKETGGNDSNHTIKGHGSWYH